MSHLTLAFAGTPDFAVPALNALVDSPHAVVGVFTQPDRRSGRGRELSASPIKQRALQLDLPVFQPQSLRTPESQALLAGLRVDALIVVAYGQILPAEALALPRLGCFNIHASLLPRWRGAAPIQRAILAGDARTGVSVMRMEVGLDSGPVVRSVALNIGAHDTSVSLHRELALLGARLMCEVLENLASDSASAVPQPQEGITYAAKIDKAEAEISWSESAAAIDRRVRAFNPWPVAQTHLQGVQLRLWESEVLEREVVRGTPGVVLAHAAGGIDVACGSGVLRLTQVQSPGKTRSNAAEALRVRDLTGAQFGPA